MAFRMRPYNLRHVRSIPSSATLPVKAAHKPFTPVARMSGWKGTGPEDHCINRVKRGDTTGPVAKALQSALQEKRDGNNIMDKTKSGAITERDEYEFTKRAELEFPEAPRPIIGMEDERGKVRS